MLLRLLPLLLLLTPAFALESRDGWEPPPVEGDQVTVWEWGRRQQLQDSHDDTAEVITLEDDTAYLEWPTLAGEPYRGHALVLVEKLRRR